MKEILPKGFFFCWLFSLRGVVSFIFNLAAHNSCAILFGGAGCKEQHIDNQQRHLTFYQPARQINEFLKDKTLILDTAKHDETIFFSSLA